MKASDAVRLSVAYTERVQSNIPHQAFAHISAMASRGKFSAAFDPMADFGVQCTSDSMAETQCYALMSIINEFEELGYDVEIIYIGGNKYKPIDLIRVKW